MFGLTVMRQFKGTLNTDPAWINYKSVLLWIQYCSLQHH